MAANMFRNHLTTIMEGRTGSRPNSETPESLGITQASQVPTGATYRDSHPSRFLNRSQPKRSNLGAPTLDHSEKQPPSYRSIFGGVGGSVKGSGRASHDVSRGSHDAGWASNEDLPQEQPNFFERQKLRGGWKRLVLALLLLIVVIIALAVGLGVGLTQRHNNSASSNDNASEQDNSTQPFPIGSWTIPTYLTNTSTACSSNSLAWNCPPYTDYSSSSPQPSFATFDWIINSTVSPPSNDSLTVSSVSNPFYITFNASKLELVDAGMSSERYTFNFSLPRQIFPRGAISADGVTTICFFNDTIMSGSLYTKQSANLLSTSAGSSGSNEQQQQWPAAAYIAETANGGTGVPDCYPATNGAVSGPRITQGLDPTSTAQQCSCIYENGNGLQ